MNFIKTRKDWRKKLPRAVDLLAVAFCTQSVLPTQAFAADGFDAITQALQTVSQYVIGPFGAAVAILALCIYGLLAWAGGLRAQMALNFLLGLGLIFGATGIVGKLISAGGGN